MQPKAAFTTPQRKEDKMSPEQLRMYLKTRIDVVGECWEWVGLRKKPKAYPRVGIRGRQEMVHRLSHEAFIGPIPDGLVVDHKCRNTICINPAHLEAVTSKVNSLRGISPLADNARKTNCHRGHEFTPENTMITRGGRTCRTCNRARFTEWQRKQPKKGNARSRRTHCPSGHPYDDANTYHYRGRRECRACRKEASRRWLQ